MKKVLGMVGGALVGLLLLAAPASAQYQNSQVNCNAKAMYDASTNGATVLLKAATGQLYFCGYTLWAGGTATVKFEYGTGSTCGTGKTAITPAFALTAQTGVNDTSAFYRGLGAPGNVDICIETSAGVAVQGVLYYRRYGVN